jgi:hypothetical protein
MATRCAYFDLSSHPPDPTAWDRWSWPAKLWRSLREREFDSVADSVTPAVEPPDHLRDAATGPVTVEAVVTDGAVDVGVLEFLERVVADGDRFPSACPHEAEGGDVCPLHAPPDTGPSLSEYVESTGQCDLTGGNFSTVDLARLETTDRPTRALCLDFSRVGRLELEDGAVRRPLSLCEAHVGTLSAVRGRFGGVVHLERTRFGSGLVADDAVFDGQIRARGVSVGPGADVSAERTTFRDHVCFDGATVRGELDLWNAVFEADAEFRGVDVHGDVRANWADFHRYADFHRARFRGNVDLGGAFFHESLGLSEAHVEGDLLFGTDYDVFDGYGVTVGAATDLTGLTVGGDLDARRSGFSATASFERLTVEGDTDLSDTTFGGATTFAEATFRGTFTARAAHFERETGFDGTVFEGPTDLGRAEFLRPVRFDGVTADSPVDLTESTVRAGLVRQPTDGETYYDLREATVGDVDLQPRTETMFDHYRVRETEFDGFDFSRHLELLTGNWRIHRYTPPEPVAEPSTAELVSTYLKAKNGANSVGAKTAASEFFMREMRFRRRLHWETMLSSARPASERAASLVGWVSNWFLNVTCGYGERALRTVGVSVAVVLAFAPVYWLFDAPGTESALGTLSFSTQAFATLIFGQASGSTPVSVQFLGAAEGFAGAFLIALFVFALTRSIHR